MKLHSLKPAAGSVHKSKRIGRGQGSGKGGTSTKGHKGGQARTGYSFKPYFEGGQMPIQRRVPKFGFKNPFRVEYTAVNLDQLQKFKEQFPSVAQFDKKFFVERGVIGSVSTQLKVLGRGELKASVNVVADKYSEAAKQAIENSGGQALLVQG